MKNTPEAIPAFLSFIAQLHNDGEIDADEPLPVEELVSIWMHESPIIAIANTSVLHVEGVGILRMVHRADTENCKVWFKELCVECEQAVFLLSKQYSHNFLKYLI